MCITLYYNLDIIIKIINLKIYLCIELKFKYVHLGYVTIEYVTL